MAKEHHDFNDVIADPVAGAFMVLQILIGGFPDASGFFLRNGIAGSAIKVSSAALDFNKDKQMPLAGHKIKFPMTGTVVLGLNDIPLMPEIGRGCPLPQRPKRVRSCIALFELQELVFADGRR